MTKLITKVKHKQYGSWVGDPQGTLYQHKLCAVELWDKPIKQGGVIPISWHAPKHQCKHVKGHGIEGLFCYQHKNHTEIEEKYNDKRYCSTKSR